jgi:putative hydrolase of the HAD superfamily
LSDKKPENYQNLLEHLKIPVGEFLMIGNSLKSDVMPIMQLGAMAIHVPFHTTWAHEEVPPEEQTNNHLTVGRITDILKYLK